MTMQFLCTLYSQLKQERCIISLNPISLNGIKIPDMKCPSHLLSRAHVIKPTQLKMPMTSCHQRLPFRVAQNFMLSSLNDIINGRFYLLYTFAFVFWYPGLLILKNQVSFLMMLNNALFREQSYLYVKELGKTMLKLREIKLKL